MDGAVEMIEITKGLVGEKMPLQVAPGMFDVVQLGGVLRQPFDAQPRPRVESGARGLAGMDRTVVEDEHDRRLLAGTWAVEFVEPPQQGGEVAAFFGPAGVDDEVAGRDVER